MLADIPNALPYHRAIETSSNGYLLRQYLYSSLYDRMRYGDFHVRITNWKLISLALDPFSRILKSDGFPFSFYVLYGTVMRETYITEILRQKTHW